MLFQQIPSTRVRFTSSSSGVYKFTTPAHSLSSTRSVLFPANITSSGWLNPHPLPDIAFLSPFLVCFSDACNRDRAEGEEVAADGFKHSVCTFARSPLRFPLLRHQSAPAARTWAGQCCTALLKNCTFPRLATRGGPQMTTAYSTSRRKTRSQTAWRVERE